MTQPQGSLSAVAHGPQYWWDGGAGMVPSQARALLGLSACPGMSCYMPVPALPTEPVPCGHQQTELLRSSVKVLGTLEQCRGMVGLLWGLTHWANGWKKPWVQAFGRAAVCRQHYPVWARGRFPASLPVSQEHQALCWTTPSLCVCSHHSWILFF